MDPVGEIKMYYCALDLKINVDNHCEVIMSPLKSNPCQKTNIYCIAQLCGRGKYWRIWQIDCHSPIFYQPCFLTNLVSLLLKPKLPNISPPILGDKLIRQYFPPPCNCAIWYIHNMLIQITQGIYYYCKNMDDTLCTNASCG